MTNSYLRSGILGAVAALIASVLVLGGCGKPSELAAAKREGLIPVTGAASFGTQCPFGTISPTAATRLQLWDCPIGLERLTLTEPLDPVYLSVDCKKRILTVRRANKTYDTAWEVFPDGRLDITIDGG
ncbi:MAG: hypothetical protein NDJ90_03220, partial [Oligoflexia bacterium]|nr:hypothetical protein [Oligoflexia bacterium]